MARRRRRRRIDTPPPQELAEVELAIARAVAVFIAKVTPLNKRRKELLRRLKRDLERNTGQKIPGDFGQGVAASAFPIGAALPAPRFPGRAP